MAARLILVGGFLGSGKTTLLWEAARRLTERGRAVGLVTNDQAPDLVDTAFLSRSGAGVREVAGSCFCCNFDGFIAAVRSLVDQGAEVVIAEPVGSCTDLSATILQPLKDKFPEMALAPLTVLVDPARLRDVLQEDRSLMHRSALYILRLQMEEADRVLLNKIDTLSAEERGRIAAALERELPGAALGMVSARNGDGIDAWLDAVLDDTAAGRRIVAVDYDRYAEGEAVLGWLNAVVDLRSNRGSADWGAFALDLMARLHEEFRARRAEVGHVKLVVTCNGAAGLANLTRLGGEVTGRDMEALTGPHASLILNARVQMSPDDLEAVVRRSLAAAADHRETSAALQTLRCLMPGRPNPTFRYADLVPPPDRP
ncbi:MAG: cobalamin synthesis protein P47K [Lentisphaerae bacterium]|nr:cobalamin synthesis protein P47K [Lentisphaerota bacterium]